MVPILKALRGLFFRMVRRSIPRCSRARGQKSGAPAGPPPSGSVFAAAKRSRASRPPPRALCQPCQGRKGPWQTWHDLILRGRGAALSSAPALFIGGGGAGASSP